MPKRVDKPFNEALIEELEERDWSQRELARQTRKQSGWGATMTISNLCRGELPPTIQAIEAISKALKVPPERFCEYRMLRLRRDLNPVHVGFRRALRTLHRLEG